MYVADTHAWVYYLLDKLPTKANNIFISAESGETTILVPSICLAECVHLVEKDRITLNFEELFSKFEIGKNFLVTVLNFEIIKDLPKIKLNELHDRIIVATANQLNCKLITKDKEIMESGLIETIW